MKWRNEDYNMAYVFARGYYEGRANGDWKDDLSWMTQDEIVMFGRGYDRGVSDYHSYDEEKRA